MSDEEYKNWLRQSGVDPLDEIEQPEIVREIPRWIWGIVLMIGFKAIHFLWGRSEWTKLTNGQTKTIRSNTRPMKRSLLAAAALLAATPALAADDHNSGNGLAVILIAIGINFLPVIIAWVRKHNARGAILAVLLLLDFLFLPTATLALLALLTIPAIALGWFACLIWSLNGNTEGADKRRAEMIALAMRGERTL